MEIEYIIREGNRRLLLFWAGWGADIRPFEALRRVLHQQDCCICYDYSTPPYPDDMTEWQQYDEIELYAWSFGVWAASTWLSSIALPITRATAINGTPFGIDDTRGIAHNVFDATLARLDDATLEKFDRRMCDDNTTLQNYRLVHPTRKIASLKQELQALKYYIGSLQKRRDFSWSRAIIGTRDRIFLPQAQAQAWKEYGTPIIMEEIAHYTDFASLIANDTIDKQKVAKHFSRAAESYDAAAVVQHDMAQRLLSLLPENFDALHILEIGCGTGLFTKLLAQRFTTAHFTINDLCPTMCDIATQAITNHTTCMAGDAEQIDFHGTYGLITSAAAIQWFSNLPDFLSRIEASLANDGIILFSTFGSDNLKELRHTTGKGLPYFSSEVLQEIFERYYTDVSVVEERHTLMFDSPIEVLRHMQQTGANGLTGTHFSLRRFSEQYQALYTAENGSVSLTYHPIYIIARKKHNV